MGNLRSVLNAFRVAGAATELAACPEALDAYDALVFPGQGCITDCVRHLAETGLDRAIAQWIAADRPFFGICLGLQALFEHSEEGDTSGLGIFPGRVRRFRLPSEYKVPHMGWNRVSFTPGDPMLGGIDARADQFYFVHSYHVVPDQKTLTWCETDYGGMFCSGIRSGRCYATQFHPEKSQSKGLRLYRNFLEHVVLKATRSTF